MIHLPPLYFVDKKAKTRVWNCMVDGDTVIKLYGEQGGKLIEKKRTYDSKNIGHSNETTPHEQALKTAYKEWDDQVKDGYEFRCSEGKKLFDQLQVTAYTTYKSLLKPNSCEKWSEEPKVLKYFNFEKGVFVQPKYDGIRCLASRDESSGEVIFCTRDGKELVWLNHIREELKGIFEHFKNKKLYIDGEIYAHNLTNEKGEELDSEENFSVITGAARPVRKKPHPLEKQLKFYIFDTFDYNKIKTDLYGDREKLKSEIKEFVDARASNSQQRSLLFAPSYRVHNIEEITHYHDIFSYEDFEGVIIRDSELLYTPGERSMKLRKHKYFSDSEFKIVGAECDPGVDTEYFTWICETPGGERFNVKPRGTSAKRRELFSKREKYISKPLKVKYQILSPNGVQRFARGLGRRYD